MPEETLSPRLSCSQREISEFKKMNHQTYSRYSFVVSNITENNENYEKWQCSLQDSLGVYEFIRGTGTTGLVSLHYSCYRTLLIILRV